ncbi:MAG: serine/threonine protein kinase [Deltaproteobacteria bacterium]|nr:serine/threonine protein kinase [Deltaproteobacteria bacterium]
MSTTDQTLDGAVARIEAFAKTMSSSELALDATIRPSFEEDLPATRGAPSTTTEGGVTLPRLEVRTPEGGNTADLELVRTLGEGGMGIVWLARQRTLAREVAVKQLKGNGLVSEATTSLLAEARATGALEHPSVVPIHALGADDQGRPLLVMKRIEGESLQALVRDPEHAAWAALERRHGDRLAAIVEILGRVADALHFAHARGIVHRDVKPENVMIGSFGEVYLVDWGVALRLEDAPQHDDRRGIAIVGTPAYMAPEMARGAIREIDARTDVYLLGATLHAAITGKARHDGRTLTEVLLAALSSRPRTYPSELAELGALANRATSESPSDRPESALAFREGLTDFVRHRGSLRLSREAETRLATLERSSAAELASPEATRALTESRFALTQALREWPENVDAKRALDRALRAMITAELERRSPEAAAALLAELASPDPALAARIESLRAEVAEARRLEEAARREERERDPRRTAKQRAWIAAGLIVLTIVLVTNGWQSEAEHAGGVRSMREVLVYDAVLLAFATVGVVVFRRRLFSNRLGRQTALVLVSLLALAGVSDAFFWARDADPREAGAFAMLAMASVLTGAGIGIDVRFLVTAAFFLTGAIVCALVPSLTVPAIGAAAIGATSLILIDALRQLRAKS